MKTAFSPQFVGVALEEIFLRRPNALNHDKYTRWIFGHIHADNIAENYKQLSETDRAEMSQMILKDLCKYFGDAK
jgi:hypothetical protein